MDMPTATIVSALAYGSLYFACREIAWKIKGYEKLNEAQKVEWASRMVSVFHAIVAFQGAMRWIRQDLWVLQDDYENAFGTSELREYYMRSTQGYLIYDLLLCLYHYKTLAEASMLIHHTVIIFAYSAGLHYQFGTFYMGCFLLNEVTTPLLNLRWFMLMTNRKETSAYLYNGVALCVLFFIFRVVLNTAIAIHLTTGFLRFYGTIRAQSHIPVAIIWALPILSYVHCLINNFWFYYVFRMVAARLRRHLSGIPETRIKSE